MNVAAPANSFQLAVEIENSSEKLLSNYITSFPSEYFATELKQQSCSLSHQRLFIINA